jgi:hypothetical protein
MGTPSSAVPVRRLYNALPVYQHAPLKPRSPSQPTVDGTLQVLLLLLLRLLLLLLLSTAATHGSVGESEGPGTTRLWFM